LPITTTVYEVQCPCCETETIIEEGITGLCYGCGCELDDNGAIVTDCQQFSTERRG